MRRWVAKKNKYTPMRKIGNPVFSNPAEENIMKVSVRPMLMGLQLRSGKWVYRSLTTQYSALT
jgi:hypothetical protein